MNGYVSARRRGGGRRGRRHRRAVLFDPAPQRRGRRTVRRDAVAAQRRRSVHRRARPPRGGRLRPPEDCPTSTRDWPFTSTGSRAQLGRLAVPRRSTVNLTGIAYLEFGRPSDRDDDTTADTRLCAGVVAGSLSDRRRRRRGSASRLRADTGWRTRVSPTTEAVTVDTASSSIVTQSPEQRPHLARCLGGRSRGYLIVLNGIRRPRLVQGHPSVLVMLHPEDAVPAPSAAVRQHPVICALSDPQSGNASGPRSLSSRASPEASSAGSHEYG